MPASQPRHGSPLVVAQRSLQPGYGARLARHARVRLARAGEEPGEASRGRAVEGVRADLDLPGQGGADGLGPGDGGQAQVAGPIPGCLVDDHPLAAHPDESLGLGDGRGLLLGERGVVEPQPPADGDSGPGGYRSGGTGHEDRAGGQAAGHVLRPLDAHAEAGQFPARVPRERGDGASGQPDGPAGQVIERWPDTAGAAHHAQLRVAEIPRQQLPGNPFILDVHPDHERTRGAPVSKPGAPVSPLGDIAGQLSGPAGVGGRPGDEGRSRRP